MLRLGLAGFQGALCTKPHDDVSRIVPLAHAIDHCESIAVGRGSIPRERVTSRGCNRITGDEPVRALELGPRYRELEVGDRTACKSRRSTVLGLRRELLDGEPALDRGYGGGRVDGALKVDTRNGRRGRRMNRRRSQGWRGWRDQPRGWVRRDCTRGQAEQTEARHVADTRLNRIRVNVDAPFR